MTSPEYIPSTTLPDRSNNTREVREGSLVELLPPPTQSETYRSRGAQKTYEFHKEWLGGIGPFRITNIGRWPCGKIMLYLHTPKGENSGNPGVYATDFRFAG